MRLIILKSTNWHHELMTLEAYDMIISKMNIDEYNSHKTLDFICSEECFVEYVEDNICLRFCDVDKLRHA